MLRLTRLYSKPEVFTPIRFNKGINIIFGERVGRETIEKRKTIGVGKSMCIEFINFCLLKKTNNSRVMKIPDKDFSRQVEIKLDLEINGTPLTISRAKGTPETPTILKGEETIHFSSLDDATNYLTGLLYSPTPGKSVPSFRDIFGPLIRDERSEFKDIINCYDTRLRIPPNYPPYLYLLGIDIDVYMSAKEKLKEVSRVKGFITELRNKITDNKTKKMSDARAELNALDDEVARMSKTIENLKTNEAFDSIQKDLVAIENKLEKARIKQKAIRYELKRIESLPKPEAISEGDIEIVYNQFKQGLGDMVGRSLSQVKEFKAKIENFQQTLINERKQILTSQLNAVTEEINSLDDTYSEKVKVIDQKGVMKDLKAGLRIYDKKNEELSEIRSLFKQYDTEDKKVKRLNLEKEQLIFKLGELIEETETIKMSFNKTISDIHELIMGNRECSFNFETVNTGKSQEVVRFDMRTYDDGSHSVERSKVFIFDMALMFNEYTRERHPKLLIHDNIFDVDQDTLVQSLNFLEKQEERYDDFQYILTLNRDKIESEERQKLIRLDIPTHKVAAFTKQDKFLKKDYKEI